MDMVSKRMNNIQYNQYVDWIGWRYKLGPEAAIIAIDSTALPFSVQMSKHPKPHNVVKKQT